MIDIYINTDNNHILNNNNEQYSNVPNNNTNNEFNFGRYKNHSRKNNAEISITNIGKNRGKNKSKSNKILITDQVFKMNNKNHLVIDFH